MLWSMDDALPLRAEQTSSSRIPSSQTPPAVDEEQFIARLKAGDDAAYEQLVRSQVGRLLVVAQRITGQSADAHDAVQEALLSAYRNLAQFDGRSKLSTWLHRITVNAALMRVRSRGRRPERSLEPLLPSFREDGHHLQHPSGWKSLPSEELERSETRQLVRRLISELPESYRTVLLLRDIEELDTAETATALGVSEGVVKTRLHRARQALRTLLDQHFAEVLA